MKYYQVTREGRTWESDYDTFMSFIVAADDSHKQTIMEVIVRGLIESKSKYKNSKEAELWKSLEKNEESSFTNAVSYLKKLGIFDPDWCWEIEELPCPPKESKVIMTQHRFG